MNAIQSESEFYFYLNQSHSARLYRSEIDIAFRDAILQYIFKKIGDEKQRTPENFQWIQQVRDDLSTLIKDSAALTPSNGTAITNRYYTAMPSSISNPDDYYQMINIACLIDGYTVFAKPTTYNEIGEQLVNSFTVPTNIQPYYNEKNGAYTIWRSDSGTFTSAVMTYIKQPTSFTIGSEDQLIDGGAVVTLTNASTYYATQVSVYNAVTYQIGATITGVTAQLLTSGQVILTSNTTPIDLPEKVHTEICKMASVIALKNLGMYEASQAAQSEIEKV